MGCDSFLGKSEEVKSFFLSLALNSRFPRPLILGLAAIVGLGLGGGVGRGEEETAAESTGRVERDPKLEMHLYLKGRHVYEKQCAVCHGDRGRGDGPWAEGLTDKPRNFRSGIFKFRTTPFGKLPTEDDLRRTIRSGISGTAMPTFQKLSDGEVEAVIVYLTHLSRTWDDEALYADPLDLPSEVPDWFSREEELRDHEKTGSQLFAQACAACHGPKGHGDGPASKGLIDAWEQPVLPAVLAREHHKSGDRPTDLYRTIATGLNGTPMVGFEGTLESEQIWDLVAYLKSIEGTAPVKTVRAEGTAEETAAEGE